MKIQKDFIDKLYELKGYIQNEISVTELSFNKKCDVLEAGRLKGHLEILRIMLDSIDDIVKEYFKCLQNEIEN